MMTTLATFKAAGKTYAFHDVRAAIGADRYQRLPYVARVLAENIMRHLGRPGVTRAQLDALADPAVAPDAAALPLSVPGVVLPDSSGIPVLMDLAALRSEIARSGGDPAGQHAFQREIRDGADHRLRIDPLPVSHRHAGGAIVLENDLRDLRVQSDFPAASFKEASRLLGVQVAQPDARNDHRGIALRPHEPELDHAREHVGGRDLRRLV